MPLDHRKKPADIKVRVSTGAGVDIVWADHHGSHYDFAYLREQCPCAMCDDERRKKENLTAHTGRTLGSVLPWLLERLDAACNMAGPGPFWSPCRGAGFSSSRA